MPVPKHKSSKTRSRIRRANGYYPMNLPALSVCPNCGIKKIPHRVCYACGYYKGKQVVSKVVAEKE
jgi:large subunit ribosomal protein L32